VILRLKIRHASVIFSFFASDPIFNLAQAQTFYVATNGIDQVNNGNQQAPWASISYAIDQVPDGATIDVGPGTYNGRVRLDQGFDNGVQIRLSTPYKARLRHDNGAVVICFTCRAVTLEDFDIAHASNNTGALLIQIQNSIISNVTLRNNIIHDSTNNDLLKINNGARNVLLEGNIFYNQVGSDEHIDINSAIGVTVRDYLFFNSKPQSITSSYVLIKDSNGNSDGVLGSKDIKVQRNFFNWQGDNSQSFLRIGEDGIANFEADNVLVENNVRLRSNTIVGNLPSRSFAARLLAVDENRANQNIVLSNNLWSDPTASMGAEGFIGADVFDAPPGDNASVQLSNNLYYNRDSPIPADTS
jgi:hypothetical protein